MGQSGPKPRPPALRLLQGNRSKRPITPELKAPPGRPECPDFLDDYAREEWAAIVPVLEKMGILAICDKALLCVYCDAYGTFRKACEDAKGQGLTLKTKTGNTIQNPILGTRNAARNEMFRALTELGLSPSARARLGGTSGGAKDPIEAKYFS
jgi:P27 family predicted phage terminase small subunit